MDNLQVNLEQIRTAENIEFLAKQVVEGFIIGLHKSPFHGFSVEFAEHRLYNPGEPTKNLDWKVFARSDKMFVKKYEEETNLRCQIIIDSSSSMHFPFEKGRISKLQFSVLSAAALINLLKKQRDAAGLSVFSEKVELNTKSRSSIVHQQMLYSNLFELLKRDSLNVKSNVSSCLHEIAETIHQRSLVVIFSDMFDGISTKKSEELFNALQHLKYNKHEVILFHVVDKKQELEFDFNNRPYEFVDMETSERVKLQPSQVKEYYISKVSKFEKELKLKCGQFKIDFVETDVSLNFRQVLNPFLLKRTKMK